MEATTSDDLRTRSSLALHNILTKLNVWKWDIEKWDSETWIIFHNLLLFFSMRKDEEDWAMRALMYTGGIITTLENKKESGMELSCDPVEVLGLFTELASYMTDLNSMDEGNVRICKALREMRNKLISKEDDAFAYLLTQPNLEVTTPYTEGNIHEVYRVSLSHMTQSMSRNVVKNLQFEVPNGKEDTDVEKALFEYFTKKGFKTEGDVMCCGSVYDKEENFVCCTSITVDKGRYNSVAIVSITH
jgi:hypothetical protein